MNRPIYRLHHELRRGSLYVFVDPPLVAADPVPLSLAGLRPESRTQLRQLLRGDQIPGEIIDEMLALAPRFVSEEIAGDDRQPRTGINGAD